MYLKSQKEYEENMVRINKTNQVLFSGPLTSMLPCWRNVLMLVRDRGRLSTSSRRALKELQGLTKDINSVNDLEIKQGIKFIIIELCSEK